jgi:hypothetical protein
MCNDKIPAPFKNESYKMRFEKKMFYIFEIIETLQRALKSGQMSDVRHEKDAQKCIKTNSRIHNVIDTNLFRTSSRTMSS